MSDHIKLNKAEFLKDLNSYASKWFDWVNFDVQKYATFEITMYHTGDEIKICHYCGDVGHASTNSFEEAEKALGTSGVILDNVRLRKEVEILKGKLKSQEDEF